MKLFLPTPVSSKEVEAIVERKLRWILSACTPVEVWLFGSAATGEMTEASDIDIALLFNDEHEIRRVQSKLARTPRLDNWPQNLVWFCASDFYERAGIGGLPMLILKDGRQIYPRSET